jgi:hypothetical protein
MKIIRLLLAAALLALPALAQTVRLRGQVTDESGAIVPGATVTASGPGGLTKAAVSGNDGSYNFSELPPGAYTVRASAPGLALRQALKTTLREGSQVLNLQLNVAAEKQEVTVEESGAPAVSTDATSNASATVLRGADLDALSSRRSTTGWASDASRSSPSRVRTNSAAPSAITLPTTNGIRGTRTPRKRRHSA